MSDTSEKMSAELVHATAMDNIEAKQLRRRITWIATKTACIVVGVAAVTAALVVTKTDAPTQVESD